MKEPKEVAVQQAHRDFARQLRALEARHGFTIMNDRESDATVLVDGDGNWVELSDVDESGE